MSSRSSAIVFLVLAAGTGVAIYAGTGLNAKKTLVGLKPAGFKNLRLKKDKLQLDLIVVNTGPTETTINSIDVDVSLDGNVIGKLEYSGTIKIAKRSKENPNGLTTIKNLSAHLQDGLSLISSVLDYFGGDEEAKKKVLHLEGTLRAGGFNYPFTQDLPFKINNKAVSGFRIVLSKEKNSSLSPRVYQTMKEAKKNLKYYKELSDNPNWKIIKTSKK